MAKSLRAAFAGPARIAMLLSLIFGIGCSHDAPIETIVLVVVDTLRADHMGIHGYERPTTPSLDLWSTQGYVFERAYAPSPWTLPSFGSIFTGRTPSEHRAGTVKLVDGKKPFIPEGSAAVLKLASDVPTLAEQLASADYATGAIINNAFLHPKFGLDRGFGDYQYRPATNDSLRGARESVDDALAWLDQNEGSRRFLVVHLFDPHMSYDPPEDVAGRFTAELPGPLELPFTDFRMARFSPGEFDADDRAFISAAYDEELLNVDRQLDRLRQGMEARGALDSGLLIVTSDHGEEFFDHGSFEHGHTLHRELLHVPMIFLGHLVKRGREATPVSLIDLAPTLLDAAGLEPVASMEGISLWPNITSQAEIAERTLYASTPLYGPRRLAAIRGDVKVTRSIEREETVAYDLAVDPLERSPKRSGFTDQEQAMLLDLERRASRSTARDGDVPARLEEGTLRDLRALGYIE